MEGSMFRSSMNSSILGGYPFDSAKMLSYPQSNQFQKAGTYSSMPEQDAEYYGEEDWVIGNGPAPPRQETDWVIGGGATGAEADWVIGLGGSSQSQGIQGALPFRQETEEKWPSWPAMAASMGQSLAVGEVNRPPTQVPLAPPQHQREEVPEVEDKAQTVERLDLAASAIIAASGISSLLPGWDKVYTVMMRNLPNKVTQQLLVSELNDAGLLHTYDFVYLPIDPETHANRGYAFINFVNPSSALMFKMLFEGRKFTQFNSGKVVSVVPASLQGFEANYAHYSSARVKLRDPAARPLFLRKPSGNSVEKRGKTQKTDNLVEKAAKELKLPMQQQQLFQQQLLQQLQPQQQQKLPQQKQPMQVDVPRAAASSMPTASAGGEWVRKFCPYCGGRFKPDFKFCEFCGGAVTKPTC